MALTFQVGRRPGILSRCGESTQRAKPRMSAAQRKALRDLIHDGAEPHETARYGIRRRTEWLWLCVLAPMLVVGALALFEGAVFFEADTMRVVQRARPRVEVSIVRLPSDTTTSASDHSSVAANRTM